MKSRKRVKKSKLENDKCGKDENEEKEEKNKQ